jgi:hypothetical protein
MADDWQRVGIALRRRIEDELRWTLAEAIEASGVSDKTLTGYMDGQPIKRRDKKRDLCEAIGWAPDSIERLLRGEDAEVVDEAQFARETLRRARELQRRFQARALLEGDTRRGRKAASRVDQLDGIISELGERVGGEADGTDTAIATPAALGGKLSKLTPEQITKVDAYIDGLIDGTS